MTYIAFIFGTGMLSDRYRRRKVLMSASILFIFLTVPAFAMILVIQFVLGAMLTLNDGTLPSFLAELFPTHVRYSGFAISFNLTNAIFGGTAPFVATLLINVTGSKLAPAWYLAAAAIVSLIAVYLAKETAHKALAAAPHTPSPDQELVGATTSPTGQEPTSEGVSR